jgi:hypothetical protein
VKASHDCEKWKKKFQMVFTRDRGTLDLSLNPQLPVEMKNMTLNPQSTSRVGNRILLANYKFWIIYINVIAERLNDFAKATLRTRLFGDLESG